MVYKIPKWCGMTKQEHFDGMGGCLGISAGFVSKKGEAYCKDCEFNKGFKKGVQ